MKKKLYIIHGYNAYPQKHWFPWLKAQMQHKMTVEILAMPHASAPQLNEWLQHIQQIVENVDDDTYFVAHSLGTAALLNYLHNYKNLQALGGMILVSGFGEPVPNLPELNEFTATPFNFAKISSVAKKCAVIAAKNDAIVPFALSERVAKNLQADFYACETGGHFMQSEGFTSLPLVQEIVEKMLES